MDFGVTMRAIGVVRTAHTTLAQTPIQSSLNRAEQAVIEIDPRYAGGLDGLSASTTPGC